MAHRDIKPHNILYVNDRWKLCDFGMSKFLDNTKSYTNNHTLAGKIKLFNILSINYKIYNII